LVFALVLLPLGLGQAEHTPEHRFTISGYVYDETGSPRPGLVVVKDRADNVLGTTTTSSSGYYQLRLHLHNSDLAEKLVIHSQAGQRELTVRFEPDNKTTERTAEVNFGVVPPSSFGLLGDYPFIVGSVFILAVFVFYTVIRRWKKRRESRGKRKLRLRQHQSV
jgi:hypothetical protein